MGSREWNFHNLQPYYWLFLEPLGLRAISSVEFESISCPVCPHSLFPMSRSLINCVLYPSFLKEIETAYFKHPTIDTNLRRYEKKNYVAQGRNSYTIMLAYE